MTDVELEFRVQALEKRLEDVDARTDNGQGRADGQDGESKIRYAVKFASDVFRTYASTPRNWDGTWGSGPLPRDWDDDAWLRFERMLFRIVRQEVSPEGMCQHDVNVIALGLVYAARAPVEALLEARKNGRSSEHASQR